MLLKMIGGFANTWKNPRTYVLNDKHVLSSSDLWAVNMTWVMTELKIVLLEK